MGIIERRLALIEKSKKWAEEETSTTTATTNTMPIEKPNIDPELKEFTQKRLLRFLLIIGAAFTGIKGIEGVINNQTGNKEFPTARFQPYEENPSQSEQASETEFIVDKRVSVYGTAEDGLLLRKNPGKSAEVLSSAFDGESFLATGQSAEADGLLWLQIEDENGNIYWAASNWLK